MKESQRQVRLYFVFLLFATYINANFISLTPDVSFNQSSFSRIECLKNILGRFVQSHQIVFFKEELHKFGPGITDILSNLNAVVWIEPKPEVKLIGKDGFFVLLPFVETQTQQYQISLKTIHQSVDNRFLVLVPLNFSENFLKVEGCYTIESIIYHRIKWREAATVMGPVTTLRHKLIYLFQRLMSEYVENFSEMPCRLFKKTNSMKEVFRIFWDERIANVVALKENEMKDLVAFTFFPFSDTHCSEVGDAVILDVWQAEGDGFLNNVDLYPLFKKTRNLHGCTLNGLAKTRPPESIVYPDPEINDWVLEGTGGKLLQIAMEKLHFTTNITIPPNNTKIDRFGYDISTGIPNALDEALNKLAVDFAFGIFSHIIYDKTNAHFSKTVTEECFTWVVPDKAGRIPSIWSNYINEFDLEVWSLILITFLTVSVAIYGTTNIMRIPGKFRKFQQIYIYEISTMLAVSLPAHPKSDSLRVLIFQWLFYCLVISTAYQSSLGSFMTVPWSTEQIKELDQILQSNFNITGQPQAGRILTRSAADNLVLQKLSKRFIIHSGFYDDVIDMIESGEAASFGAKRFIQFYSINRLGKSKATLHIIPECVLLAHSSPFMFKIGSILEPPINRIITGLVESGITDYWFLYSIPKTGHKLDNVRALQVNQIKGLLIILSFGHTLAAILLCLELVIYRCSNSRNNKETVAFTRQEGSEKINGLKPINQQQLFRKTVYGWD